MFKLYGDGVHDDFPAIQEMIDSGRCEVSLPAPEKHYLISKTLTLPSYFKLSLPRYAVIKLADGANCPMLRNKWTPKADDGTIIREGRDKIWNFATRISPLPEHLCTDIEISGGIWDFNNMGQAPNPLVTLDFGEGEDYTGFGFQFFNVKNLRITSMTLKDPITFALTIDICSYFTIDDITFDFNFGNPIALNMDGVHLDGYCHHGAIRNLKGSCYDDLVALNAHEGYPGPITNIEIDGIFAESCHSAIRLLAINEKMENIHISNIYGTYYQYCIGFTKFYPEDTTDGYDSITIENVYASKALREWWYPNHESYVFPFIWIQDGVLLKNLSLRSIHRREYNIPIELLHIGKTVCPIESIIMSDVTMENYTEEPIPLIKNVGEVKLLSLSDIRYDGEILCGDGVIENLKAL